MNKYGITYTSAMQLICDHQIKQYMKEKQVSYEMACPSGLLFDTSINTCNWSNQVKCKA